MRTLTEEWREEDARRTLRELEQHREREEQLHWFWNPKGSTGLLADAIWGFLSIAR